MQKNVNTDTGIIEVQWQNNSCTVNIYNKLPEIKYTQGAHSIKCTNVQHIIYIVADTNDINSMEYVVSPSYYQPLTLYSNH